MSPSFDAEAPKAFTRPTFELCTPLESHDNIRTGAELLRFNAENNADLLYCLQAKKPAGDDLEFDKITFKDMYRAVLNCAAWIKKDVTSAQFEPCVDEEGKICRGAPVALLLGSDIGVMIHILALSYLGIPAVLLSARLSPPAIAHLLEKTSAKSLIVSSRVSEVANEAINLLNSDENPYIYNQVPYDEFLGVQKTAVPEMCDLVSPTDRNVLILHSSGTTGLPKPIYHTHRYLLGYAGCHQISDDSAQQPLNLSTLPLYHGFGLLAPSLGLSIGMPFCLPSASTIPTAELTVRLSQSTGAQSLMTVPSILEDLLHLPASEGVTELLKMDFVAVGGGPIKPSVGEQLSAAGVKLLNHAGATEIGAIAPIFRPDEDYDWHYLVLRKDIGLRLEPVVTTEGSERHRLVGFPFGWGTRFEVQDLLECNPKHPETQFKILGRNDDLLVLANGEKVLPRILESTISALENVKAAVAYGEGRFELGIIIEPGKPIGPEGAAGFVNYIWPHINEVNEQMDEHARVSSKSMVIVATDGKSIPRSDKGSCMRKETYRIFEREISDAYERLESNSEVAVDLDGSELKNGLKRIVQMCLRKKLDLGFDDDFFEYGLDSLQAIKLFRILSSSLKTNSGFRSKSVTRDFVFRHTTINKMAKALLGDWATEVDRIGRMKASVREFGFTAERSVVLLTGSTGSLGSFLVAHLSQLRTVEKVICLTRKATEGDDAKIRQLRACESRGIQLSEEYWSKIEVIEANLKAPQLGLDDTTYTSLNQSITHIIHNAWPMDFNRAIESFEPHFQALQNLLQLAMHTHQSKPNIRPRIVFTSSIAAVGQYPTVVKSGPIPEVTVDDASVADNFGYAEAKWVCEKILENAGARYSEELETTVVRIGQLTGSERSGFWNSNEHFPALIKSSQLVGHLPVINGTLSWLPVDVAAEALAEIVLHGGDAAPAYHLENPVRQPWEGVLEIFRNKLGLTGKAIPFDQWWKLVEANNDERNVAKRLAKFFHEDFHRMADGTVVLETKKARGVSKILRDCPGVDKVLMERYVDAWRSSGFLG
ncbi:Similar to Polyketide synthase HetM; acc. no. P37693 [Pyronema omphalodes CBS 100304]|uniref:Similar to Polyketide synthase HetM acc. no. P37693 n=1 Tax=Pyronema omphalodes (strain CBS 100304) TaxID=1076935 RepID=U4KVH9_PYROM|nr:Similar to Polyketide synthase HetM; acc. no. P37693 [Pyronema omphalodes CBS 100304]